MLLFHYLLNTKWIKYVYREYSWQPKFLKLHRVHNLWTNWDAFKTKYIFVIYEGHSTAKETLLVSFTKQLFVYLSPWSPWTFMHMFQLDTSFFYTRCKELFVLAFEPIFDKLFDVIVKFITTLCLLQWSLCAKSGL